MTGERGAECKDGVDSPSSFCTSFIPNVMFHLKSKITIALVLGERCCAANRKWASNPLRALSWEGKVPAARHSWSGIANQSRYNAVCILYSYTAIHFLCAQPLYLYTYKVINVPVIKIHIIIVIAMDKEETISSNKKRFRLAKITRRWRYKIEISRRSRLLLQKHKPCPGDT